MIKSNIWRILEHVTDPEIPVLTIVDLGIVRDIIIDNENIIVNITSTYTGCPAMDMIAMNIKMILLENGFSNITVKQVVLPAWTTDWITENGKEKLKEYGIAPPQKHIRETPDAGIECPQCGSLNTTLISEFGSTACKALYKCLSCKEPFDYFKCY